MKIRLIALLASLFIVVPSFAQFWDGNYLVTLMREHEKAVRSDTTTNFWSAGSFSGFVIGVHDSQDQREFCSPSNATVGQITAVVAKYLNAHPEQWNESAHALVRRALKEGFPCSAVR